MQGRAIISGDGEILINIWIKGFQRISPEVTQRWRGSFIPGQMDRFNRCVVNRKMPPRRNVDGCGYGSTPEALFTLFIPTNLHLYSYVSSSATGGCGRAHEFACARVAGCLRVFCACVRWGRRQQYSLL